jgi:tetratricopeptide (TPR) repeat protein
LFNVHTFLNRRVVAIAAVVLGMSVGAGAQTPPPTPSPAAEFNKILREAGGPAKARAMFDTLRKKDPKVVLFDENEMNLYGYELLNGGNTKDAIVVFQMNVDAFPKKANVYDSLSDAQLAAGAKVNALKNAEKALALLPGDTSLVDEEFRGRLKESAEKKVAELKPKK